MPTLYDSLISGNGYKCRLVLAQLNIGYDRVEVDILKGESRTPEFLTRINPNGRVPAYRLDDGRVIFESNAIIWYLAEATPLLPDDRFDRAQCLQWMFFEQYSHEPYVAVARFIMQHTPDDNPRRSELGALHEKGAAALKVMDQHLRERRFFVADRYTVADVALYAYTHVAHEGGYDLTPFPHVNAWMARVRELPGHIPITKG